MYFKKRDILKIVLNLLLVYFVVLIMSYTDTVSWGLWKKIPFHLGMLFIAVFDRIKKNFLSQKKKKKKNNRANRNSSIGVFALFLFISCTQLFFEQ